LLKIVLHCGCTAPVIIGQSAVCCVQLAADSGACRSVQHRCKRLSANWCIKQMGKLVNSRLILMLLYDSLNLIISGVHNHIWAVVVIGQKKWSWEVWTMLHTRCASALSYWKTKLLYAMCLVAI